MRRPKKKHRAWRNKYKRLINSREQELIKKWLENENYSACPLERLEVRPCLWVCSTIFPGVPEEGCPCYLYYVADVKAIARKLVK